LLKKPRFFPALVFTGVMICTFRKNAFHRTAICIT